jgi:hypothetical protein
MKEKINIHNYEIYLIDYLDNKLSNEEKVSVRLFLENNPEIAAEFELLNESAVIVDNDTKLEDNSTFKKQIIPSKRINENNYEDFFVAHVEKQLSNEETIELHQFVSQNPCLNKEFAIQQKTILQPDLSLVFLNKNSLKRRQIVVLNTWYKYAAVAAILLLLMLLISPFINNNKAKLQYTERKGKVTFNTQDEKDLIFNAVNSRVEKHNQHTKFQSSEMLVAEVNTNKVIMELAPIKSIVITKNINENFPIAYSYEIEKNDLVSKSESINKNDEFKSVFAFLFEKLVKAKLSPSISNSNGEFLTAAQKISPLKVDYKKDVNVLTNSINTYMQVGSIEFQHTKKMN